MLTGQDAPANRWLNPSAADMLVLSKQSGQFTPDPQCCLVDNPKHAHQRFLVQQRNHAFDQRQHAEFVLHCEPQHNQSGIVIGRECTDVGKIQMECHQCPLFIANDVADCAIGAAT